MCRSVSTGFVLEHDPAHETARRSRAESIELRLTALRVWLLRVTRADRIFLGRAPSLPVCEPDADMQVARLDAGKRERMLWLVHDTARVAHRDWERGEDPCDAMRDLATALARVAEYDV